MGVIKNPGSDVLVEDVSEFSESGPSSAESKPVDKTSNSSPQFACAYLIVSAASTVPIIVAAIIKDNAKAFRLRALEFFSK